MTNLLLATLEILWILNLSGFCRGQSFRAAAFEHADPFDPKVPLQEVMLNSLETFKTQAQRSAALGVHILVFPEYGLSGVSVPDTREGIRPYLQVLPSLEPGETPWIPCLGEGTDEFNVTILKQLSCAARSNAIVLVVNLGTVVECASDPSINASQCPSDGVYQFNTNVAFGADGAILATYHKINLYREPMYDRPPYPAGHVTTFQTNVTTFGLITCFDLLWHDPLITLVEERGIRHVAMPTAWVDGLPFLTSVQSQLAWALALNITLVAANIQNSKDGYRGSGIYNGEHGFLNYVYGPSNASRLIWADVSPSNLSVQSSSQRQPDLSSEASFPFFNYSGIIYDDLSNYTFVDLNASEGSALARNGILSCSVEYKFEGEVDEGVYRLSAYDGFITLGYGEYRLAVQTCALLWCPDTNRTDSCSRPPVTSTSRLLSLKLEGNFSTPYVYPSVLRADLLLIDTSQWFLSKPTMEFCNSRRNASQCVARSKVTTKAQLITNPGFAHCPLVASLYGRAYDKDTD